MPLRVSESALASVLASSLVSWPLSCAAGSLTSFVVSVARLVACCRYSLPLPASVAGQRQ